MDKGKITQRFRAWIQGRVGQFLLTQGVHTTVTIAALAVLLLGAVKVGALDGVMTPLAAPAQQTSFNVINYQGRLADGAGAPLSGNYDLKFAIYDSLEGGTRLWPVDAGYELHEDVPVSDGLFSVHLGGLSGGIPPDLFSGGDVWLEVMVETETLSPREQLTAVPYALEAGHAVEADTVPDGSVTNQKLALSGTLDLGGSGSGGGIITGMYDNLILENQTGNLRGRSENNIIWFIDTNNNNAGNYFSIYHDNSYMGGAVEKLFEVTENGELWVLGSVSHGALIENNLQTPDELAADTIDRFSEGDVLCWGDDQLELCNQAGDPLVQAVADANGKPIVIGAEVIRVLGPVQHGDLLVASGVPGYATVDNNPQPGSVIAQALEDFDGDQGLIRAMIRKF